MHAYLEITGLNKQFKSQNSSTSVLNNISFKINEGDFISVVGPSGCGKTTLLKCISGLLKPTSGQILLSGKKNLHGKISLIFQEYNKSLFPWKTVSENVAFGLERRKRTNKGVKSLMNLLRLTGLEKYEAHYPSELSGGLQQRVALARALGYSPNILLMDEPFSSLDAYAKQQLEDCVLELSKMLKITVLFVTHDISEAIYLSDRVLVFSEKPACIVKDISIKLPYPRQQLLTRQSRRFLHYRKEVFELLGL